MSEVENSSSSLSSAESSPAAKTKDAREWVEDLQRTVIESKDSAIRSARSLQHNSSTHFRSLQVLFFLIIKNKFFNFSWVLILILNV